MPVERASGPIHLGRLLPRAAALRPDHPAVVDEHGRSLTYAELDRAADRLAARLDHWGIGRGDRVGIFLPKSIEAVAVVHGTLRRGAVYVPVDAGAPPARGVGILADAGVKAVVLTAELVPSFRNHWPTDRPQPRLIAVGSATDVSDCESWDTVLADEALGPAPLDGSIEPDDLAYILYTSGSTGTPKGVMLSHANAFCFLDWCDDELGVGPDDRFGSHAPFHFDLSVFDLYMACRHAATLVLIGEALGKDPVRLGPFLSESGITVWYSAPSILALLSEWGGLDQPGRPAPRLVLFAGEVFPIGKLRRLRALWPESTLWNLYGPTETNVCTAYRVPELIPPERDRPLPIGPVCPPLRARVVDENGGDVAIGAEGELVIAGPGVMRGYFGRPDLTARAFFVGPDGTPWYRTGDLVIDDGTGCHEFHGRRDRMIKKRGYRIELGEIESAIYRYPGVERAAVIARHDESGTTVTAFVALEGDRKRSVIALKRHCAEHLPAYMVPDTITFLPSLPTTSTDKVDYQRLASLAQAG